jgi:hypothetical protein
MEYRRWLNRLNNWAKILRPIKSTGLLLKIALITGYFKSLMLAKFEFLNSRNLS